MFTVKQVKLQLQNETGALIIASNNFISVRKDQYKRWLKKVHNAYNTNWMFSEWLIQEIASRLNLS